MQSQRNKVKMPLLLYSLFLVIAILATFNYFLSTGLPTFTHYSPSVLSMFTPVFY
jgi:hypothetical protein